MNILKYTTLDDIKDFLATFDYKWNGLIKSKALMKIATIEDFNNHVQLEVEDGMFKGDNRKLLGVIVSDTEFFIEDKTLQRMFNYRDHSLRWQTFLIKRKDNDFAKKLYAVILAMKNAEENRFNKEINLVKKQADKLAYEKSLLMSKLNTTLYNIESQLPQEDKEELFKDLNIKDHTN